MINKALFMVEMCIRFWIISITIMVVALDCSCYK